MQNALFLFGLFILFQGVWQLTLLAWFLALFLNGTRAALLLVAIFGVGCS